ncbi:MAG: hypothetical protein GXY52_03175 [Chloroflexi bacterium]|nr:hypothetical protein [Chloroflexota bacterium]
MTFSFRISPQRWLTDESWEALMRLFSAHPAAIDELSLFTREYMGWFSPMDVMRPEAELMGKRVRQAKEAGIVSAGINVLSTLGHGDPVGDWSPEFTLPRAMGPDGVQATHCPCPNSAPFREYIRAKYALFAAQHPDFIWVDDDVRGSHHGVLYPCLCPICLERFGQGTDREALVRRLNDPAEADLRRAMVAFNADTLTDVCREIGEAIREVDPSIEIGLMTIGSSHSTWGGHALERETAALGAVKGRPGHGFYNDANPHGIYNKAMDVGRQVRDYSESVVDIQYELENYPYITLDKADRTVLNETYLAIMMGCNGAAYNAIKGVDGGVDEFSGLVGAIAAERPAFETLIAHAEGLPILGFWPADDNALMGKRAVNERGWFWEGGPYDIQVPNALVEMGIPLTADPATSCGTLLAGRIAEAFSDMELRAILARGVLLDAQALQVLWSRGLGELTGAKPGKQVLGGAFETLTDHPFNCGFAGEQRDALVAPADQLCALDLLPGAEALATIVSYDERNLGVCQSAFTNALGGRVVVSSYPPWRMNGLLAKRTQLAKLADWLAYGKMPARIDTFSRVAPFIRIAEDGSRWAALLLNSTLDESPEFELRVRCNAEYAWLLDPEGADQLDVRSGDEGEVIITVPSLAPWQPAVILGASAMGEGCWGCEGCAICGEQSCGEEFGCEDS